LDSGTGRRDVVARRIRKDTSVRDRKGAPPALSGWAARGGKQERGRRLPASGFNWLPRAVALPALSSETAGRDGAW